MIIRENDARARIWPLPLVITSSITVILACTPLTPPSRGRVDRAETWPDPTCDPLPPRRPAGAQIAISRRDGETMERSVDAVFIDEGGVCPRPLAVAAPACYPTTAAAMDAIWAELRSIELHRVVQERHGECIHCGGPWIAIQWPGGACDRGMSVAHGVARGSWERFDRAVRFLEGIVARVQGRGEAGEPDEPDEPDEPGEPGEPEHAPPSAPP